jgi:hypothetical protein
MIGSQVIDLKTAASIMVGQENCIISILDCQVAVDANICKGICTDRRVDMGIYFVPLPASLCLRR